jgi:hypothetical protein
MYRPEETKEILGRELAWPLRVLKAMKASCWSNRCLPSKRALGKGDRQDNQSTSIYEIK